MKSIKLQIVKNGMKKGMEFLPLPSNSKAPICKGWNNKTFRYLNDFNNGNLGLHLTQSKDVVCFDIDCKQNKGFSVEQIKEIHNIAKEIKATKIYVETSVSQEGLHIITKLTEDQIIAVYEEMADFNGTKTALANNLEFFYTNKQICIYPSVVDGKQCIPLHSTLLDIDYLDDDDFQELLTAIKKIATIMGPYQNINNIVKSNTKNTKRIIESNEMEIELPTNIKKYLNMINSKYFYLANPTQDTLLQRKLLIKKVLEQLNIDYEEDKTLSMSFAIFSLIEEDGQEPNAHILANYSLPVYWDFHLNEKANWLYILYAAYKEDLLKILEEIFSIKPKITKPIITVKTRNELYKAIKTNINKKILVIAPTGFGKTSTIKKLSEKYKICMIEPLAVQVSQEFQNKNKNTICLWEEAPTKHKKDDYSKYNLIFTTSAQIEEKYPKYESLEHITVIDEAHTLISDMNYREKTIQRIWKLIENKDNWIMMTATPRFCNLEEECDVIIQVESQEKENRFVRKCIIKDIKNVTYMDAICSQIKKSDDKYGNRVFHIIYIDSEKELMKYKEGIEKILPQKTIKIVTAEEVKKNPEIIADIVKERKIESNILLCTRKLSMGFHIEQNGVFEFHILNGDVNIIEQMINRIRHYSSNGYQLKNIAVANVYTKKKDWKYFDYATKFELYYENLKNFVEKLEFEENTFTYTNFMRKIRWGNKYTLKGLIYEALVSESGYNTEYLVKEIEKSGWKRIKDITIDYADKVKVNKKEVDKDQKFKEVFEHIWNVIENQGKDPKTVFDEILEEEEDKLTKKMIYEIREITKMQKLDKIYIMINEEELTYRQIVQKVNEWKLSNDIQNTNIKDVIKEYVKDKEYISVKELKEYVGNVNKATSIIKTVMKELGYVKKQKKCSGRNINCWVKC